MLCAHRRDETLLRSPTRYRETPPPSVNCLQGELRLIEMISNDFRTLNKRIFSLFAQDYFEQKLKITGLAKNENFKS